MLDAGLADVVLISTEQQIPDSTNQNKHVIINKDANFISGMRKERNQDLVFQHVKKGCLASIIKTQEKNLGLLLP